MPYITKERKYELNNVAHTAQVAGELNYNITRLLTTYIANKGLSYQTINDIIGALEGAKLEFYRRIAAPYEDLAKDRNGDVYI